MDRRSQGTRQQGTINEAPDGGTSFVAVLTITRDTTPMITTTGTGITEPAVVVFRR